MPLKLEDAKVTMVDPIDQMVIDEFRRSSLLLDMLTFDDAVAPATGGSTLTYGYTRLKTPSTATSRALNTEYTADMAIREVKTAPLKIFGGSFELDRVLQDTSGSLNEIDFQLRQKILGARNYFHHEVINGKKSDTTFEGLDVLLNGSTTEYNGGTTKAYDLSVLDETKARTLLEEIDNFLSLLDGRPDALLVNTKLATKLKSLARWAGYYSRTEDAFGQSVDNYDNIPIIDLGFYYDSSITIGTGANAVKGATTPVIPMFDRTIGGKSLNVTDMYAVSLGLDGFHGITPQGGVGIKTYMPDMSLPGAVKKGEVEMVAGVALKNTLKAGVMRNIQLTA